MAERVAQKTTTEICLQLKPYNSKYLKIDREDIRLGLKAANEDDQVIAFRFERKVFEEDREKPVSVSTSGWYYITERIPNIADEEDLTANDSIVSLRMLDKEPVTEYLRK